MVPQAKYEHILINDSDIVAPADYLRRVISAVCRRESWHGDVALSRIRRRTPSPSKLEALGLSTDFMGGVLVARELEGGVHFALGRDDGDNQDRTSGDRRPGSAGRLPRRRLRIGSANLARRDTRSSCRMSWSKPRCRITLSAQFWTHQMRWARNVRDRRQAQYFGLIVTFGLAWGMLAVLAAPHAWWTLGRIGCSCRVSRDCGSSDWKGSA